MQLKIFQIDAFTKHLFGGNPAAVCPLGKWLDDATLQHIAAENNLSETAFFVEKNGVFELRWFTPKTEVNLCGHATLAAAWVISNEYNHVADPMQFITKSGELRVTKAGDDFTLDFPLQPPTPCELPQGLLPALGIDAADVYSAEDYLVVVEDEKMVKQLTPDFSKLNALPLRGVIVTAPGNSVDFVSRWFGPNVGVDEDPVTGSAHTTLAPYWANRLGKNRLSARQISQRIGELVCEVKEKRVFITGSAVKYMEGQIQI